MVGAVGTRVRPEGHAARRRAVEQATRRGAQLQERTSRGAQLQERTSKGATSQPVDDAGRQISSRDKQQAVEGVVSRADQRQDRSLAVRPEAE